jgi:SAM-dependent methyltransferase
VHGAGPSGGRSGGARGIGGRRRSFGGDGSGSEGSLQGNRFYGRRCGGAPYDDISFDAVACCFGLLHLPEPAQGVCEAYRVLKAGGRYSVTLWNRPERGGDFFRVILQTVSTIADMNVDLPKAPPMFELSEPGRIEVLMSDAGFADIQRVPIASAWRARRAEDIVELLNYGTVRMSLFDLQKQEIRERIMEELVKAFRPYERGTGLEVGCSSIMATGVKLPAASIDVRFSNRPFGVKHFQTIHLCGFDVARGLALLFGIGTKALVWGFLCQGICQGCASFSFVGFLI